MRAQTKFRRRVSRFENLESRRVLAAAIEATFSDPAPHELSLGEGESTRMISDAGGFEGSNQKLDLGSNMGAEVTYSYEHFFIPDNFIIRYDGQNVFQTGFTGGSSSGTVRIPAGNDDFVQVIVATNDSGTAWEYTASAESCLAPEPYVLTGGNVQMNDDGTCTARGTVTIGHSKGNNALIRVENASITYDDKQIMVSGTVFSQIGSGDLLTDALFTGSFDLSTQSTTAQNFSESGGASEFELGGQETTFSGITLGRNSISLGISAKAVEDLGLPDLFFMGSDGLIITENGARFGSSVSFSIPNFSDVNLFSFLIVKEVRDIQVKYIADQNAIQIRGKITIELNSKSSTNQITADFAGENFIQIKDGMVDVVGELSAIVDLNFPPRGWGLSEVKLKVDTIKRDVLATAKLILPFRGKITTEGTIGFKTPLNPLELNSFSLTVDNLNVPVPPLAPLFFQSFTIGVSNFAESDPDPIEATGGVGFTAGPQVLLFGSRFFLIRGDVDATISNEQFKSTGTIVLLRDSIGKLTGQRTFNWDKGFYEEKSSANFFDGFVTSQASFKADRRYNINAGGSATVGIPDSVPFIGGYKIASGNYLLDFSNNGNFSDDFVAGWGVINFQKFGFEARLVAGAKLFFNGDVERIGSKNIPPVGSFEIEPNTPWFTMSAAWENESTNVELVAIKPDGTRISEADFEANNIFVVDELDLSRSKTLIVFDAEPGIWDVEVADANGLGAVQYAAGQEAVSPTIDVSATQIVDGALVADYSASDPDSDAEITFFLDTDGEGLDGIELGARIQESDTSGSANLDLTGIAPGTYQVYARISDGDNPPVYGYAPSTVTIGDSVDLTADLVVPVQSEPGSTIPISLIIENNGTEDAVNSLATVSVPVGVSVGSTDFPNTSDVSDQLQFDLGTVAPGQTITINFDATLPNEIDDLAISAHVSSDSFDSDFLNDSDFEFLVVREAPTTTNDLRVEYLETPKSIEIGQELTYTIRVTNDGASTATGVVISERFADNADFVEATTTIGTVQLNGNELLAMIGDLEPGASADINIRIRATAAGPLVGAVEAISSNEDVDSLNDQAVRVDTATGATPEAADLSLSISSDEIDASTNEVFSFSVTLANDGPGVASAVEVSIPIPEGLRFVSATGVQGTYDESTEIWSVGNVRDNLSRTLTISLTADERFSGEIAAEVSSVSESDPDSTPGNQATMPGEDDGDVVQLSIGPSTRVLAPSLLVPLVVIPGDEIPTAIIFRATTETTVSVIPIRSASMTENVQILGPNAQTISSFIQGVATAELQAGTLNAIIFHPSTSQRLYSIQSSSGFSAITSAIATNPFQPTDANGDGQTTAQDALMVINALGESESASDAGGAEAESVTATDAFLDVNADGNVTVRDALKIINKLYEQRFHGRLEAERIGNPFFGSVPVRVASLSDVLDETREDAPWMAEMISPLWKQAPIDSNSSLRFDTVDAIDQIVSNESQWQPSSIDPGLESLALDLSL